MTDEGETGEGFAIEQGPVAESVHRLLMTSSAGQWISVSVPPPFESGPIEFRTHSLPVAAWSTGERMLWEFAASAAGVNTVNVKRFVDYFAYTPLRPLIEAVVRAVLDVHDHPDPKSPEPFPWVDPTAYPTTADEKDHA